MSHASSRVAALVLLSVSWLMARPTAWADEAESPGDAAVEAAADDLREREHYELLKLFADTFDQIERNYVKEVDRRVLIEGAIEGMMAKLDPYSDYIAPNELERFRSGVEAEYGGIGIQIELVDGQVIITSSTVGGPAYRAGLLAGDRIVKIGEESTDGITRAQAVKKLKGPLGSSVTFTAQHPDASHTEAYTLTREVIRLDTVMGDRRRRDHTWEFLLDPEKKIGYVRINAFSRHTAEELRKAVKDLQDRGMKGLVLDLRDNPGGLLSAAIEVCDLFVKEGRIVSTQGRATSEKKWDAHAEGTFEGFPLAVLVNNYSASASEIVSACLQDHGLATIVGQRTWGKGSVQNIIELEDGDSALKLTTSGYRRPSGKNIDRHGAKEGEEWGVTPDAGFEIALSPPEIRQLREYRKEHDIARRADETPEEAGLPKWIDPQLQRALTFLDEKLGLPATDTAQAPAKTEEVTMPELHDEAKTLAKQHYQIEDGITDIYEIVQGMKGPDRGQPRIRLLEVNENTIPSGIVPIQFDAVPASGVFHPSVIVEVTPDEFEMLKTNALTLPPGWEIGPRLPHPNEEAVEGVR